MNYDQWISSLCLWREARGSNLGSLRAIYWVLQNRVSDHLNRWPKSIPGVILQKLQFSSFNSGDPNSTKFPNPSESIDWQAFLKVQSLVQDPGTLDPTSGANHYESIPEGKPKPSWCDPTKITLKSETFTFYKL